MTREVGLLDAVSSSPASKETTVFYTLLDTLVPVFTKIYPFVMVLNEKIFRGVFFKSRVLQVGIRAVV